MNNQFKKRKVTPLSLLNQVKKNGNVSKQRNSMLAFIEEQSTKINNRYGDLLQARNKKSSKQLALSQDAIYRKQSPSSQMVKLDQSNEGGFQRSRFHSMQRVKRNQTTAKSPYMSQERRRRDDETRVKTEPDKGSNKSLSQIVKSRLCKAYEKRCVKKQREQRSLRLNICGQDKIFKHFENVLEISTCMNEKNDEKQIIQCIKQYILQQEGDSAEIEGIYLQKDIVMLSKNILFLEKVLIVMVVDLLISHKFRIVHNNIRLAFNILIAYYLLIYQDMTAQIQAFPHQNLNILHKHTIQCLNNSKSMDIASLPINQLNFANMHQHLLAKIKHCFRFSKNVQSFYNFHKSQVQKLPTNLNYFRLLEFYSLSLLSVDYNTFNIQFLQTCPSPYLHYESPKKYTLLLDLDETLIHYKVTKQYQGQFLIRPYLFEFLAQMSHHYEIGIFTCSMPEYADIIINHMKQVSFRLYRHHTIKLNCQYVKDLDRVGRDIRNMIIVDNLNRNFRLQKENGIHVRSWYGDKKDDILKKLAKQLKNLALQQPQDIRQSNFTRSFL